MSYVRMPVLRSRGIEVPRQHAARLFKDLEAAGFNPVQRPEEINSDAVWVLVEFTDEIDAQKLSNWLRLWDRKPRGRPKR